MAIVAVYKKNLTFMMSAILVLGTPSCSTVTAVMRNLSLTKAETVVCCAAISTVLVDPAPRQYMDGRTLYLSGDVVLILYTTGLSLEFAMVNLSGKWRLSEANRFQEWKDGVLS